MSTTTPHKDEVKVDVIPVVPARDDDVSARSWTAAIVIVTLLAIPILPLILFSFGQGYFYPQVLPDEWGTRAWKIVLDSDSDVWPALVRTVMIALCVAVLSVIVAIPAGRALGLHRFRGKRLVEFMLLSPVLVPVIAIAIGIHVIFIRYGLANTTIGVILVHLVPATPYVVLIMSGVFANYDPEYEQQARSLGASWPKVFRLVTLPAIAPGLAVGLFFGFLISWSQYILTLVIGGGSVSTLPILLFSFAAGGDTGVTSALALFYTVPAVLLLVVNARVLGSGHALGGTTP